MNPHLASRLARIHMEATTYGAGTRFRSRARRDRKALRVALVLMLCTLGLLARGWL